VAIGRFEQSMSAVASNPQSSTASALAPGELADLVRAVGEVTARLETTHRTLRAEVARLTDELRQANEQVERSRRLAALGEMAAGIAHEVRNPVGSIRLYAGLLEQDLAGDARAATATKIGMAARSVEAIVGDVLSFAREVRVRHAGVACRELLERALESCRNDSVPGWREVEVRWLGDGRAEAWGDESLLTRALSNIIRNAFEAMHEQASSSRVLGLESLSGRESITLRVRDTGPGVRPDAIARMFNPFFTTRAHGTGLGLAMVHRIIDAHAGRIVVRNHAGEPGPGPFGSRGTCVEIVLPARTQQETGIMHSDDDTDAVVRVRSEPASQPPAERLHGRTRRAAPHPEKQA
jgi:signal transduction histidine kinase